MASLIIGLTGGIGSGKTTVSDQLAGYGIDIIDADVVAREIVAKGSDALNKIEAHFGNSILNKDKSLNRSALRSLIFQHEHEKQWLNSLLHPLIRQQLLDKLAAAQSEYAVLSAPLLFENGLDKYTDRTLLIDIEQDAQISRSVKRDNSNETQIRAIINSQMPRTEKCLLADDIISNTTLTFSQLNEKVKEIHLKYLELAKN
ncbi:dephospho-CoA kinase [Thalassotalea sp. 1_MG-2023]|uniref:dephospho-CoA kinase n=1 Tax=Thalassotalea sp. 1_MG-2023 TaxID=3062680 RepID=UPI0026E19C07|nr:dephospho-CoA kinase [Thalassotalea sp. 1_MG-2023]MDO6427195.1 dephospho-CoA kinase [Thalassotalea sp. 1_MG-2023]